MEEGRREGSQRHMDIFGGWLCGGDGFVGVYRCGCIPDSLLNHVEFIVCPLFLNRNVKKKKRALNTAHYTFVEKLNKYRLD